MNDDLEKDSNKESPLMVSKLDPTLPWEVKVSKQVREKPDPPLKTDSQSTISTFAKAGKINVLSKIAELRKEMETVHRENQKFRCQSQEWEQEKNEYHSKVTELETELEEMRRKEQHFLDTLKQMSSEINQLQSQVQSLQSEKQELELALAEARTSIDEIQQALHWNNSESIPE